MKTYDPKKVYIIGPCSPPNIPSIDNNLIKTDFLFCCFLPPGAKSRIQALDIRITS